MKSITLTLVSEGSSDRTIIPILLWLLAQRLPDYSVNSNWADFSRLANRPKTLTDRIQCSLELYPCDVLFIHRDADKALLSDRKAEIADAVSRIAPIISMPSWISVIPVRMTEAWLLIEEKAIRRAAGNPQGRTSLNMPKWHELEMIADPKQKLFEMLRNASELSGRRLRRFSPERERHRVSEFIEDFTPLRHLRAFQEFEADVDTWLATLS